MITIFQEEIIRPEETYDYYQNYESGDLASGLPVSLLEGLNVNLKSAETDEHDFGEAIYRTVNQISDQLKFCQFSEAIPCEKGRLRT